MAAGTSPAGAEPDDITASGPPPAPPVTMPRAAPPPSPPPSEQPAQPPAPPAAGPRPRSGARRYLATIVTLGVLVAAGLAGWWWVQRDEPFELAVNGNRIENAAMVLEQAEASFADVVAADGATPDPQAACFFAPGKQSTDPPRIACGPGLIGLGGDSRPWVVGRVAFSSADAGLARGRFEAFTETDVVERDRLRRPDRRRPAEGKALAPAAAGVRIDDGRRIVDVDEALAAAERSFADASTRAGAAVDATSRCYLGTRLAELGRSVSDGRVWCGPVLRRDSTPDEPWVSSALQTRSSRVFGTVGAVPVTVALRSTVALATDVVLWRPDGQQAPASVALAVPDAAARKAGYSEVLAELPAEAPLAVPRDGRLITADAALRITGLARVPKIGAGPPAIVAATGESLVVGALERERSSSGASASTATLVVDGRRSPFTLWSSLRDTGFLVVSVPSDARAVDLEVLSTGRKQTISLLTGDKAPGFPAAAYRATAEVGIGAPLQVTVALPAGDPAQVAGVVVSARLDAYLPRLGWAPDGAAFLTPKLESWEAQRPCCAVGNVKVLPRFTLQLPDGTTVADSAPEGSSTPAPRFVVPESFTTGRLVLGLTVTYTVDGAPGEASGGPAAIDVAIPA